VGPKRWINRLSYIFEEGKVPKLFENHRFESQGPRTSSGGEGPSFWFLFTVTFQFLLVFLLRWS